MQKLDHKLLDLVKNGFVPMPGGQGEPVSGASEMTAGLASGGMGMDPAAGGAVDPSTGMPMDPAAGGGGEMPMDPAMMAAMGGGGGGMPPMDPAMLAAMAGGGGGGGEGGAPAPGGTITLTVQELIQLFQAFGSGGKKKDPAQAGQAPAGQPADPNAKLDQILNLLQTALAPQGATQGVPQQ